MLLAVLLAVASQSLDAQLLRGVVVEEHGGNPVSGAIVTVITLDGRAAVTGMTNEFGRFELRAPHPGEFYIDVKRIGVSRTRTPQLTLKAHESRDFRLSVLPLPILQPPVHVIASSTCGAPAVKGQDVALLWEDARAALTATILTQNERRFLGKVIRFKRRRSPGTMRVVFEERDERSGVLATPFVSAPADQLSREGYVQREPTGAALYRAPDADVLLSDSFLADHCFLGLISEKARPGEVGLAFAPTFERELADIAGTLWFDEATHELRSLNFRYTRLRSEEQNRTLGGDVEFARLPAGAWIVRRWVIRMPLMRSAVEPGMGGLQRGSPRRLVAIQETGGEVVTATLLENSSDAKRAISSVKIVSDSLPALSVPASFSELCPHSTSNTAAITGVVRDSVGIPLAGARIRLTEHHAFDSTSKLRIKTATLEAVTNDDGNFLFCGVRAGEALDLSFWDTRGRLTPVRAEPGGVLVQDLQRIP